MIRAALALILGLCVIPCGLTDPLAPSLLEIVEVDTHKYSVLWKTPRKLPPSNAHPLQPQMPQSCTVADAGHSPELDDLTQSLRWSLNCPQSLEGLPIGIQNLSSRSANTLLRVEFMDGRLVTHILTPETASLIISERQTRLQVFKQYVVFGAEHLAIGIDHILFLLGLILLTGFSRTLVVTVTLFTFAHSITLSLTVLELIVFPVTLAEVFIAFSIVFTLAAYLKRGRSESRGTQVYSIAFGFGLLHGLGFASVLQELGLPQGEVPVALLAFNLGIELGQLILIALLLLPRHAYRWLQADLPGVARRLNEAAPIVVYGVGTVAAFWYWQRMEVFLGI